MTNEKEWAAYQNDLDEIDREDYKSKVEELSRCLPVVRAALGLASTLYIGQLHSKEGRALMDALGALHAWRLEVKIAEERNKP